jgi:predicted Zn-dependent protease
VVLNVAACGTANLAPIGQTAFKPEEDEQRIWKEARELQLRFDRSGLVFADANNTNYLNQVASKLIPETARKQVDVQVRVLKHPIPNAFALPHGALYIHTGMLARMENEAQLAAVISHEIVHILHRHTLLTFRNQRQAAGFASTLAVIGAPAGLPGLGVVVLGSVGALAAVSGYSQSLEAEADADGLRLMVSAGYDPKEAVKVFQNVKCYIEEEEIKEPFFFSTHPRLEERLKSYQRLLNSEYSGKSGYYGEEEFIATIGPTLLENAFLELASGRFGRAQETLEKSLSIDADNPRAHFLLAEVFRQKGSAQEQQTAEQEYQKTIELAPDFAAAYRGLGLLDYKLGRADLAKEHFEIYLMLNPAANDRTYIEQYLRDREGPQP